MGVRTRLFLLLLIPMAVVIGGYGLVRVQQEEEQLLAEEQRRMAVTAKALQVAVESEVGAGTTFRMRLPAPAPTEAT
ncbi:MAG: hypothetical protein HY002_14620 [Candidatus Rokubacteria bacterium]|nr:hypothetical protein [Candidatus Rokubacteria bacterium]